MKNLDVRDLKQGDIVRVGIENPVELMYKSEIPNGWIVCDFRNDDTFHEIITTEFELKFKNK